MTTVEQIVPADVVGIRQGYGLVRTYSATVGGDRYAVRVDIERNSHDFQSHYRTEFLTADGWKSLHRISPEGPDVSALPSYTDWIYGSETKRAAIVTAVEEVAERLLAESTAILSVYRDFVVTAAIVDLGPPDGGGRYWRVMTGEPADHPDAIAAAVTARATGSVGATYNEVRVERAEPDAATR